MSHANQVFELQKSEVVSFLNNGKERVSKVLQRESLKSPRLHL